MLTEVFMNIMKTHCSMIVDIQEYDIKDVCVAVIIFN